MCRQEMCVCELVFIWSVGVGKAPQRDYMVLIDHGDMANLDSLWTSVVGSQE